MCFEGATDGETLYQFITNGVLLNVVGVLGIIGNVISMIVLSNHQMRSSINYLLIGLARCDTILIITSILLFGIPAIHSYTGFCAGYTYYIYPQISFVAYPVATIAQTTTVYLTLTVTLERFVAVCHPLRARSLCTYGRARSYVIAIVIFSVLYNLPRFWEVALNQTVLSGSNETVFCVVPSAFRRNELYISVYINWMYLVFLYVLPFSCLAVLNLCIYRQVLRANAERQRLSRSQRREIGLATMLCVVVVVFFICNFLAFVNNILESLNAVVIDQLVKTSNFLVTINSSVNFIIYVIFGEKFKRIFLRVFCTRGFFSSGRDSPDGQTHEDSFISNGDRQSFRLHRQSTTISRNGGLSVRINGSSLEGKDRRPSSTRVRTPSPCVYYPAARLSKDYSLAPTQASILPEEPANPCKCYSLMVP